MKMKNTCMSCTASGIDFNDRKKLICVSRESGLFGKEVKKDSTCKHIKL